MRDIPLPDLVIAVSLADLCGKIEESAGYSGELGRADHRAEAVAILRTLRYALCMGLTPGLASAARRFLDSVDPDAN